MSYTDYPTLHDDIGGMSTEFLECRTIGHSWSISYMGPVAASHDEDLQRRADLHEYLPDGARVLACDRCSTERIDLCRVGYARNRAYSYTLITRQYRYPNDYRVPGAHKNREMLHEELFTRFFDGHADTRKGRA